VKQKNSSLITRILTLYIIIVLIVIAAIITKLIHQEVKTSKYQAQYLSQISRQLSYKLVNGQSSSVRYPQFGPYDQRMGYTLLPDEIELLKKQGYDIIR